MDLNMHRSGMFAKLIQIDTTTVAQHKGKLENNICTAIPRDTPSTLPRKHGITQISITRI